jgi:hypothetical protein
MVGHVHCGVPPQVLKCIFVGMQWGNILNMSQSLGPLDGSIPGPGNGIVLANPAGK